MHGRYLQSQVHRPVSTYWGVKTKMPQVRVLGYVCCVSIVDVDVVFSHLQSPRLLAAAAPPPTTKRLTLFSVTSSTLSSVASTSCSRFCSSSVLANLLLPPSALFFLLHLNFFFPPLFLLRLLKMKALSIELAKDQKDMLWNHEVDMF